MLKLEMERRVSVYLLVSYFGRQKSSYRPRRSIHRSSYKVWLRQHFIFFTYHLRYAACIYTGWRLACDAAFKALEGSAQDHSKDQDKLKEDLLNIARTTLSSKILKQEKDHFAKLAVDAVLRLKV